MKGPLTQGCRNHPVFPSLVLGETAGQPPAPEAGLRASALTQGAEEPPASRVLELIQSLLEGFLLRGERHFHF